MAATLPPRVAALESRFRDIGATRMQGVPILHPGLEVKALGFEPSADGSGAVGVLLTPWFMNLVWLPLGHGVGDGAGERTKVDGPAVLPVGAKRTRAVGHERFEFIGGFEHGVGAFETCSLFSPMFDFVDQAAALATAEQVLAILRAPPPPAAGAPPPSRRELLFGRVGSARDDTATRGAR